MKQLGHFLINVIIVKDAYMETQQAHPRRNQSLDCEGKPRMEEKQKGRGTEPASSSDKNLNLTRKT